MKMQLNKAEVKVEYAQMLDSVVVLQSYDEGISSNIEDENYRESIDEVDYNNQSKVHNEPLQDNFGYRSIRSDGPAGTVFD